MTPSRRRFALGATLVVLALTAACAGSESGASGPASGMDAPDHPLTLAPTPVYRIGGMEAPEWAGFGRISGVAFDPRGNLYILDAQTSVITVVAPDGSFLRTIGTPGQGPGELASPLSFALTTGGEVAVLDVGHQGFVVYDTTGAYLRNVRLSFQELGVPGRPLLPMPDGSLLAPITGRIVMPGQDEGADTLPPARPLVRVSLDGETPAATFYRAFNLPPTDDAPGSLGGSITVRIPRDRAFEPPLALAALGDGRVAVADSFGYRIKLLDGSGAEVETLERPVPPTPVTDAIQDQERERRLAEVEAGDGPRFMMSTSDGRGGEVDPEMAKEFMRGRLESMVFAPAIPVIEAIAADSQGRIWVQRSSGVPGEDGPTDLVTADGRYLGTLPPDGLRIPDAFGPDGLTARIETDELDVPTVVVERLPAGSD